ncbi:MAG: tetratricopeptide repeat protein [Chloroflexi bacterium]|nr:tetratricopeptide repeat protein [Chloroflexota bacterium]
MDFSDIELEYAMGNHDKARRLLSRYLRDNPQHTNAWELLKDLARNDAERERAEAGLRQARGGPGEFSGSFSEPQPTFTSGGSDYSSSGGPAPAQPTPGFSVGASAAPHAGSGVPTQSMPFMENPQMMGMLGIIMAIIFPVVGLFVSLYMLFRARSDDLEPLTLLYVAVVLNVLVVALPVCFIVLAIVVGFLS